MIGKKTIVLLCIAAYCLIQCDGGKPKTSRGKSPPARNSPSRNSPSRNSPPPKKPPSPRASSNVRPVSSVPASTSSSSSSSTSSRAKNAAKQALPTFMDLMNNARVYDNGIVFTYNDCEIDVKKGGDRFELDMTSSKCKNVVSLSGLFKKLTGADADSSTNKFAQLDKFDVDKVMVDTKSKKVEFEAKSKEDFDLLKGVKVGGSIKMKFTYQSKTSGVFKSIQLDLEGTIKKGGVSMTYKLNKPENQNAGTFDIKVNRIKISDFYTAFSGKKMDDNPAVNDDAINGATIDNPTIKGSRSESGETEIIMTANLKNIIAGIPSIQVSVLVSSKSVKTDVGVIAEVKDMTPADLLAKFIKSSKVNLKEVPVFKDIKINALIEYGSDDIYPTDSSVKNTLQNSSPRGDSFVSKGLRMKFDLPLENVLQANGVTAPSGTNLNQYMEVVFNKGKATCSFPPNAGMDIINIAIAFVPNLAKGALAKMFKNPPKVSFETFDVDVRTGAVDISLKVEGKVGFKFMSIDDVEFTIKRSEQGLWDFSFVAQKRIGSGLMTLGMTKTGQEYQITGKINAITTVDIAETFNVDSTIRNKLAGSKSFKMALSNVDLSIEFGSKLKAHLKGTVTFLKMTATFEGYLVETVGDKMALAFGIVLTNKDIIHIVKEYFKEENGKGIGELDCKLLSQVTTSLIFANKEGLSEVTFENEDLKNADKPNDLGVSLFADIKIPADCKGDTLCSFVQKATKSNKNQKLYLQGTFDKTGVELKVKLTGELAFDDAKKYVMKEMHLAVSAKTSGLPDVGIGGKMLVTFKNQPAVKFIGELKLSIGGVITLILEMDGNLNPAFGIQGLGIENYKMEAAISVVTGLPDLKISGIIRVGTSATPVETKLAGSFGASGQFYVYGEFVNWTIEKTLLAFNVDKNKWANVPKDILDTGFERAAAGLSLPGSTELKNLGVTLENGFFFKGTMKIFGKSVMADIKISIPEIVVHAQFQKMNLAGMIKLSNYDQTDGPEFRLKVGTSFSLCIDARIEIFGIGIASQIDISSAGFHFKTQGRFFSMFQLTLDLEAPFAKDIESMKASSWKMKGCFDATIKSDVMKYAQTEATAVSSEGDEAKKGQKALEKLAKKFKKAQDEVNDYNKKLKDYSKNIDFTVKETKRKAEKYIKETNGKARTCVDRCKRPENLVQVGELRTEPCKDDRSLDCPVFHILPTKVLSPKCVGKCNADMGASLKGWYRNKEFESLQGAVKFFTAVLNKLQRYLVKAKKVFDMAQSAQAAYAGFEAKAKKFAEKAKKAKDWIKNKVLDIEKICIDSELSKDSGYCFNVDAEMKVATKIVKLDNERVCMNTEGLKSLAEAVLAKVFPNYADIKAKAKQIKSLFQASQQVDVESAEKEFEASEKADYDKRTLEENDPDYTINDPRLNEVFSQIEPYVMRNEGSVLEFNRFFYKNDDDVLSEAEATDDGEESGDGQISKSAFEIDSASLASEADTCRRSKAVVQLYDGISNNLNAILKSNKEAQIGYQNMTNTWAQDFESFGQETRAMAQMNNMTLEETNDMLFYYNYGKDGIVNWRRQLDATFTALDKKSLDGWKANMVKKVGEKNLDMKQFMDLINKATQEVSKKWEVPGKANEMQQNMNDAEQLVQTILNADQQGFVSHDATIKKLANAVNNLRTLDQTCK